MPASSPCGLFQIFDLEAVLLGPARVHAQQHRGPVLALGAAGAGMDFEIGVEAVGLAGQQRFELAARDFLLQRLQRGLGFGDDALIVLGFAEFDHARHCRRARARPCRCRSANPPARCAPASASGPSADRSRDWDLRRACSARRGGPWMHRRQRCLLSSPTDCLISSTRRSISARMASLICGVGAAMAIRDGDVAATAAKRNRRVRRASTARRCRAA